MGRKESKEKRMSRHDGDCTIYSSLVNGTPENGVCTCGYGLQVLRMTGKDSEIYSKELMEKMEREAREKESRLTKKLEDNKNG